MNENYHKRRNQKLLSLAAGFFVEKKKKRFLFYYNTRSLPLLPLWEMSRFIAILDKQFTLLFDCTLYHRKLCYR